MLNEQIKKHKETKALIKKYKALPTLSRLEIRSDFPPILELDFPYMLEQLDDPSILQNYKDLGFEKVIAKKKAEIKKLLEIELQKIGETTNTVNTINIAYPQKHPILFPKHENRAAGTSQDFQIYISSIFPNISFKLEDNIFETKQLKRSDNQSSLYALIAKQQYVTYQKDIKEIFSKSQDKKPLFIINDHGVEQGTTMGNLISYIEHNDGHVLFTATEIIIKDNSSHIAQSENLADCPRYDFNKETLPNRLKNPTRNNKRVKDLGIAFNESTKYSNQEISPEECVIQFEKALNKQQHSITALTDGECSVIIEDVFTGLSFKQMLKSLGA